MTTSAKIIRLHELYGTAGLVTRESAEAVARLMQDAAADEIALDFGSITYTSRSFLDQLNHEANQLRAKTVRFENMNEDVTALLEIVRKGRTKRKPDPSAPPVEIVRI